MPILTAILFLLLGYLCGSLTFSIWITRLLKGVDVRDAGSGHATTTNTIRQAGFAAGGLVLLLDVAKGFLPAWLALHYAPPDSRAWIAGLAVAGAVVGHCWPILAQFRGGMGLATTGGGILAANPLAFLIGVAILIALTLTIHHGARATFFTAILMAPVFWMTGMRAAEFWIALMVGCILAIRVLGDWNRRYRELWLDREKK